MTVRARVTMMLVSLLAFGVVTVVPAGPAHAAASVTVTPDTGVSGGQDVTVAASGFEPGHTAGWCQGVPSAGPPSTSFCGTNTTFSMIVDANGEFSGTAHLQRFLYVPGLGRWVDCTDPAETCIIGAADAADIPGTAVSAALQFAPPPPPPATRGTLQLVAPAPLGFVLQGRGFRPGAALDVFQCTTGADHPSDCGLAKASTTTDGAGGFQVTVSPDAVIDPPGGTQVACDFLYSDSCSFVAAEAVDFPGTAVGFPFGLFVPTPTVTPGVASAAEGDLGSTTVDVPVTLSVATSNTVTVQWRTLFAPGATDQADPADDYTPASGTVTFAPGQTTATVTVTVAGDTLVEPDEFFLVSFTNPTNANLGGFWGLGAGIITNDDTTTVVPGLASVAEGGSGSTTVDVPVTLTKPSATTVTVQWRTLFAPGATDQADPTDDYTPASGTVTFAPGQTTATVTVTIAGDTLVEPDEFFLVSFTNPTNANLGGIWGLGAGIITNDD